MVDRCKAFFGGLEVQVSFSMSRSQGVTPDIGQLVWRVGTTQPSSSVGDLVLKNGATTILTMTNCTLRNPTEQFGDMRSITYQVQDRRWKWKTPTVFGQYNVRDEKNLLIEITKKTPRELATLLLIALGETGYDVSALPTDVELSPNVVWYYTPAAVEIDKLCAMLGCSVNLMNDNTVKITVDNVGLIPDDTGLMHPVESGLIINPAPDYITAFANDTMFDSWLTLEAIGRDEDGTYKPIDMLSYTPNGSWSNNGDPTVGYDTTIRGPLRDVIPDERIDKIVELANRTVFRLFRITGFPKGQKFFPGFTLETSVAAVGNLPITGDASKVYVIADQHTVIWDGTTYVGVTWYNTHATSYKLINPLLIANPYGASPIVLGTGTKAAMVAAQTAAGIANYTVIAPGCAAVDPRILLPLMQSRVENALDELQNNTKRSAEACGIFQENDDRLQNQTPINLTMWKHGISIDQKRGHVIMGEPAYTQDAGVKPATMYLRCGYGYRLSAYGSRYHRNYNLATGNTLGIANGVVARTDVAEYRVQNYTSDYNDLSALGAAIVNTTNIDTILLNSATENLKQYQNFEAPRQKPYTPFRAIDTNGKVHQVSYKGVLTIGVTTASIGGSFDTSQPPAKLKRIQELQRRQSEVALQNFRAAAIQAQNINATGGASGIGFSGQDIA